MARSMTGFGRAEYAEETFKITVEMKSVNNRYLDFNIRMPRKFNPFDTKIRAVLKEYMERGKVDVFISFYDYAEGITSLHYNDELAETYLSYLRKIGEKEGVDPEIRVSDIARYPEVFTSEETALSEEEIWPRLEETIRAASAAFAASREAEGEYLKQNILSKLDLLYECAGEVEAHEPEIMEAFRKKLYDKMAEILADTQIEESRIAAEAAIYSDKICTDEETVRLKSHVEKMRKVLSEKGSIGKSLDFLAQEMNREANTTLSKAGDIITADTAIRMKTEIEKIREQIQNIE